MANQVLSPANLMQLIKCFIGVLQIELTQEKLLKKYQHWLGVCHQEKSLFWKIALPSQAKGNNTYQRHGMSQVIQFQVKGTMATLPGRGRKNKLSMAVTIFLRRQVVKKTLSDCKRPAARFGGHGKRGFSLHSEVRLKHWRLQALDIVICLPVFGLCVNKPSFLTTI